MSESGICASKGSPTWYAPRSAAAARCCASCSKAPRWPACPTSSSKPSGRPACPANRGSTSRTRRVADIAERLAPIDPGRPEQAGEFEGWFAYALQRGTSPNGVFGAKMMWNYFDDFRGRVRELPGLGDVTFNQALDALFPQLRIVFVRRRDKVAQAVSLWKAIQTQQWRNEVEPPGTTCAAEYDYRALKHLVDELHRWDARWEDWFHATGREPIRVIYEEFVNARAATVGRVLDALGIDPREPEGDRADEAPGRQPLQDWVAGSGKTTPSDSSRRSGPGRLDVARRDLWREPWTRATR